MPLKTFYRPNQIQLVRAHLFERVWPITVRGGDAPTQELLQGHFDAPPLQGREGKDMGRGTSRVMRNTYMLAPGGTRPLIGGARNRSTQMYCSMDHTI